MTLPRLHYPRHADIPVPGNHGHETHTERQSHAFELALLPPTQRMVVPIAG
jgi:hypothetical protein